ncbi:MAG: 50S ribosomal protein L11 [bacterium]|nr:50S ribosomal protein L11 [bacterium]
MAVKKKIKTQIKLQIPAGKANPAPPVGPALGQHGLNIMDFCKQFNDRTKNMQGDIIPVVITVYENRSFDFITKLPPVSAMIKKELNLKTAAHTPGRETVGELTMDQVKKIAEKKLPDLNTSSLEAAIKTVIGTAKSMGIKIKS